MGETVTFASNGSTAQGYLAAAPGGGPGVIVVQEWWGVDRHIKDVTGRFAAAGFVALAPDLYHGKETAEPDEAQKLMMNMKMDEAARDMSGALDYLRGRPDVRGGVGVTGFCMGGGLSLTLAALRPEIAACVPFYGAPAGDLSSIKAAVLGHYADHDDWASPEAAKALERQLRDRGLDATFYVYPDTRHAFFNDTRPESHNAEAAGLAWSRTIEFFRKHLT